MVPAFTSPAGGCIGENGPFITASYLYWKARMTDSTVTAKYNASTQTGIAADLDLQSMPFSYDSGFKLGFGKVLQHDSWSTLINWTWLESHPHKIWSSPTPIYTNYLTESLTDKVVATGKIPFILAEQVKANWDFNFNTVNLELGKIFAMSSYASGRAYGSVLLGRVYNKLHVSYNTLADVENDDYSPPNESISLKNTSWLVGPRVGATTYLTFLKGINFIANLATTVLWVDYDPQVLATVSYAGESVGGKTKGRQQNWQPGFELFLGLDWGHCFKKKVYANIALGYEIQYYGAVIDAYQSLNLNGLTATFRFDF